MDFTRFKKSTALTTGHEVAQISECLKNSFDITFFNLLRAYDDGTHFFLGSLPQWTELLYTKLLDEKYAFAKGSSLYSPGNVLWTSLNQPHIFGPLKESFNITNGITLIRQTAHTCDFYCFGSTPDNAPIVNFYLNNIDLLEYFILYFNDKGKKVLEKAESDRQILPTFHHNKDEQEKLGFRIKATERINFLASLPINQHYINDTYLSTRELQCLTLLAEAKTTKEIGKKLNISPRTVETYLQRIKDKTNLTHKSDLLSFFQTAQHYELLRQSETILVPEKKKPLC